MEYRHKKLWVIAKRNCNWFYWCEFCYQHQAYKFTIPLPILKNSDDWEFIEKIDDSQQEIDSYGKGKYRNIAKDPESNRKSIMPVMS